MKKRLLLKAVLIAVYAYILAWVLEFFIDDSLSFTFKFCISIVIAFFSYLQMYKRSKNNS